MSVFARPPMATPMETITATLVTAAAIAILLSTARPASADTAAPVATPTATPATSSSGAEHTYASRKRARLEAKAYDIRAATEASSEKQKQRWQRELDRRLGKRPDAVINIYNTWTHEYLTVDPAALSGAALVSAEGIELVSAEAVDRFLRCHYTNQPTDMDPHLIRVLVAAAQHFGVTRVDIVSGFRSPKYNRVLRKKGREVSRKSQHPQGTAVDFRLPGVSVKRLHAWAKSLRLGGVGFYPHSGFIHVDTARVRYWTGR